MDILIKDKWIEALRNGSYQQGRTSLRQHLYFSGSETDSDTFCCLGVLCDIVDPSRWRLGSYHGRYTDPDNVVKEGYDESTVIGSVPDDIKRKIGLTDEAETVLIRMNDSYDWNFNQIANWIEANIPAEDV